MSEHEGEHESMLRDLAEYQAAKAVDDGERVSLSELLSEQTGSDKRE